MMVPNTNQKHQLVLGGQKRRLINDPFWSELKCRFEHVMQINVIAIATNLPNLFGDNFMEGKQQHY